MTLALVRHGHAGSRSDWDGPDDLRPLDTRGQAEARRLAEVLPLFGPLAVYSAPPLRCRETVGPLAERLGVGLLPSPNSARTGSRPIRTRVWPPPSGSSHRARVPGSPSSAARAGRSRPCWWPSASPGRAPGPCPPAKGSVWVLGGGPGALTADYYRNFDG